MADEGKNFEILKDFGGFGEGAWQTHLTYIKWYGKDPVFDLRSWSPDMTRMGKGVTLDSSDLYDLSLLIEDALKAEE